MSRRIFRVCRSIHVCLDGEGAKRVGGRWNSPGRPVVYMAESVSLAVLENLVHMAKEDFPTGHVVITAVLPDGIVVLTAEQLVAQLGHTDQKTLGDQWVDLRLLSVLEVRSKIVSFEHSYLLNPHHPDFRGITAEPPVEFVFDERLFGYPPIQSRTKAAKQQLRILALRTLVIFRNLAVQVPSILNF